MEILKKLPQWVLVFLVFYIAVLVSYAVYDNRKVQFWPPIIYEKETNNSIIPDEEKCPSPDEEKCPSPQLIKQWKEAGRRYYTSAVNNSYNAPSPHSNHSLARETLDVIYLQLLEYAQDRDIASRQWDRLVKNAGEVVKKSITHLPNEAAPNWKDMEDSLRTDFENLTRYLIGYCRE